MRSKSCCFSSRDRVERERAEPMSGLQRAFPGSGRVLAVRSRSAAADASGGESLAVARQFDNTNSVNYDYGNAYELPYNDAHFDAVCCMDFLEHVEKPDRVIAEASRVLRSGGLFFFHTFNRNS